MCARTWRRANEVRNAAAGIVDPVRVSGGRVSIPADVLHVCRIRAPMTSPDHELLELISKYQYYPEKLASILWRWDEGELAGIEAPDTWQFRELREGKIATVGRRTEHQDA